MSYKPFVIPATATPATPATTATSQGDTPPLANPELEPAATATTATTATKPQDVATIATVAVAKVEKSKMQVLLTLAAQAGYPEYRIKDHWVFIPEGKEAWQRNLQAMLKTHPRDLPRVLAWLEADLKLMG